MIVGVPVEAYSMSLSKVFVKVSTKGKGAAPILSTPVPETVRDPFNRRSAAVVFELTTVTVPAFTVRLAVDRNGVTIVGRSGCISAEGTDRVCAGVIKYE